MKKKSIIIVLFLFVILSGCQEISNQNENNKSNNSMNNNNGNEQNYTNENEFLGNWIVVNFAPDYETWSFYTNLSAKNYHMQEIDGQHYITISWFEYIKDNTTICLSPKNEFPDSPYYFSICYSYLFFENATRLTFYYSGIVIIDLKKML